MLLDLLCSKNYLMVNLEFIKVFGIRTSIYLSYIMNEMKNNIQDNNFFEINRETILNIIQLSVEEQVQIEDKLIELNLVTRQEDNPLLNVVHISFDIVSLVNIIANGDEKLLNKVTKITRLPKTLKTGKISARQQQALGLKYLIKAPNKSY